MSLSNGVIRMWLCASLCFSGATALKSFDSITHEKEACECLNWKEVYDSGKAKCGDAVEFYVNNVGTAKKLEDFATWDYRSENDKICKYMYTQLDSTRCNGLQPDHASGNWCYVSSACSALHGGQTVNDQVSWKQCQKGEDADFEDMEPRELFKMSASPAVWAMYAYESPGMNEGRGTPKANADFEAGELFNSEGFFEDVQKEGAKQVKADLVARKKPVFFHDDASQTSGHVIYGEELWRVGGPEDPDENWAKARAVCEQGCE